MPPHIAFLFIVLALVGCTTDSRQDVRGVGSNRDQYPPSHCAGCEAIPQPNMAGQKANG